MKSSISEILNKFRWHPDYDFRFVKVTYIDRPKGYSTFYGEDVEKIGHKFVYLKSGAAIPVHRIVEICYKDVVVWRRF